MTSLIDRFEQDLVVRGYAVNTRRAYVGALHGVARYFGRELDTLTLDDLRAWQLPVELKRETLELGGRSAGSPNP